MIPDRQERKKLGQMKRGEIQNINKREQQSKERKEKTDKRKKR